MYKVINECIVHMLCCKKHQKSYFKTNRVCDVPTPEEYQIDTDVGKDPPGK